MKLLVTGGAGFIGSNYVRRRLRQHPNDRVIVVDALTYAGNLENLAEIEAGPRFRFVKGDICDAEAMGVILAEERPDALVHFAAESHVDRSVLGPRTFTVTNTLGTQVLLDVALAQGLGRFVMVSTDEVYGSLGHSGMFVEESPLRPSNSYSVSKAAADLMCLAYHRVYGMNVVVTRATNNYGPYQFPEKLIPLMIINALENKPLPVYGDGLQVRDWIHVDDHCAGVDLALERGRPGEIYNLGARNERTNLEVLRLILARLAKPESLIHHVIDRPGHDRRYALDPSKAERELGFSAAHQFEDALCETIEWYLANRSWWEAVRSGAYLEYYARQYGARLSSSPRAESGRFLR